MRPFYVCSAVAMKIPFGVISRTYKNSEGKLFEFSSITIIFLWYRRRRGQEELERIYHNRIIVIS